MNFDALTDDELIALWQNNQNDSALNYLICKYKSLVKVKVRAYFLIGADTEDLVQEGMIGLFKAIRDYNPSKISSFKAFADLCVTRQIITAVKTATRNKHIPLNSYVSLNKTYKEDDAERTLLDTIPKNEVSDPEELVILGETVATIEKRIAKELSPFELSVLEYYKDGQTYQEISALMNKSVKSIDNALQRIKRKLSKCIT